MTKMRAALYGRMSTELQNDKSCDDQLAEATEFATREGFVVVSRAKDEATSGQVPFAERPGSGPLLLAAKRREFDVLVAESLSRMGRDQPDQELAIRLLEHYGVRVITYTRDYDSTMASRKMLRGVKGLMNEQFLDDLALATHRGQKATVERGHSAGGRAYGYRSEPIYAGAVDRYGKPEPSAYRKVVHEEEAKWVRWIYRQYADGASPRAIAAELNAQGVPSPGANWNRKPSADGKRRDGKWMASAIHGQPEKGTGILCNPIYRGELSWNRTHWVRHPKTKKYECRPRPESDWVRPSTATPELRIVSDELWNAVQARRRATRQEAKGRGVTPGGRPQRYPFSGLLFCADCGARYVMVSAREYGCASHTNGGKAACANRIRVKREVIEEQIVATMRKDLLTKEAVEGVTRQLRAIAAERRTASDSTDKARVARRAKIEREIANMTDAIASGALRDSPTLATRLRDAETELQALTTPPERPKAQVVDLLPRAEAAYRRMVAELPRKLSREPDASRSMLKRVLRRVELRRTLDDGLVAHLAISPASLLTLVNGGMSSAARENTGGSGGTLHAAFTASVRVA